MVEITSLWLPILLTAAALFVVSFLAWMVLPHHKGDWARLPDESGFASALKSLNVPPGNYAFPYCATSEEMRSPKFLERQKAGPNGTLQVWSGPCNMGVNLVCTFLFFLATSFCLAYLAKLGLPPGANFMQVFRFLSTAGLLTYCAANVPGSIWYKQKLGGYIIDALLYGLATGAIFGWLWPAVPTL